MTESDRREYEGVISLCSMWWALHPEIISDTNPEPTTHPWGPLRTWTPSQRREAFLKAGYHKNQNSLRLVVPDLAPETNPESTADLDAQKEEALLLRDEGHMLELVRMHGFEAMYNLLLWLPKSNNWFERLKSLAQLKFKQNWDFITADMARYYQKALENNSESSCDEYVERIFLGAGGYAADAIAWERLHPLPPLNPQDAAEEVAMDAYDDVYGAAFFDVWAEHNRDDSVGAPQAGEPGDALFNPWSDEDGDGPATVHAAQSAEEDDADREGARYCTKCGSAHARACLNDVDYDLE
jgi:hypothetical protein